MKSGWMLLLGSAAAAATACVADVQFYYVGYDTSFRQTGVNSVAVNNVLFAAGLRTGGAGEAAFATFAHEAGSPIALASVAADEFQYSERFANEASAFASFPSGEYTFAIFGGSLGAQQGSLDVPDPLVWPNAIPLFDAGTFAASETIDASLPFELNFNGFSSTADVSGIFAIVIDRRTGLFADFAYLVPSTTSYTVPASAFEPNTRYDIQLYYFEEDRELNAGFNAAGSSVNARYITTIDADTFPPCEVDYLNNDGFATGDDFDLFVQAFELGDPIADFDSNGFVTGDDFDLYVEAFELGC